MIEVMSREKFISILKDKCYVVRDREDKICYPPDICYICENLHKHLRLCALCIQFLEPNEYLDYEVESEG